MNVRLIGEPIWEPKKIRQALQECCCMGKVEDLEFLRSILRALGNPEQGLRFLHVAGTNGKGSVVFFLASILQQAGYSVGTFLSPAVTSWNERIQYRGIPISEEEWLTYWEEIRPLGSWEAYSPFAVWTLIALRYFSRLSCPPDLILWETGIGGRLDPTNVVNPILSVITTIDYDHMESLGDTLKSIAWEKAGIIKPNVPVIVGNLPSEAKSVIQSFARAQRAPFFQGLDPSSAEEEGQEGFKGKQGYQRENAQVVLRVVQQLRDRYGWKISKEACREGFRNAVLPGRLERIVSAPDIWLDGAHNQAGMTALIHSLKEQKALPADWLIAVAEHKSLDFLRSLLPYACRLMITGLQGDGRPFHTAEYLQEFCSKMTESVSISILDYADLFPAIDRWRSQAKPTDRLIVTGSFYLVAAIRSGWSGWRK